MNLKFINEVFELLASGQQAISITSAEESRALDAMCDVAIKMKSPLPSMESVKYFSKCRETNTQPTKAVQMQTARPMLLITWDCVSGFAIRVKQDTVGPEITAVIPEGLKPFMGSKDATAKYRQVNEALDAIINQFPAWEHAIVVFRDLDDHINNPDVRRRIKDSIERRLLASEMRNYRMVLLSVAGMPHPKIQGIMTPLVMPLPTEEELADKFDFMQRSAGMSINKAVDCDPALRETIIQSLLGLTYDEAEGTLSQALIRHQHQFVPEMLGVIKNNKARLIRATGVLTYIDETKIDRPEHIGGFDDYNKWLSMRELAYSKTARNAGLDMPKGVVLIGAPGTAKSKAAMMASHILKLPLYVMDVGAIFGSLVGESEARLRHAIGQVEAQKGCVLLIDEADKGFGGAANSGGDSGTTRRVFGNLLSWLATKNDRTFVIMTMNRTEGIPPELLRAGRFDAVFSTDLPLDHERQRIAEIHLSRRGVDLTTYANADWSAFIEKTKDYVGSEIEQIVVDARYAAFQARPTDPVPTPTMAELLSAVSGVTPLSRLDKEGLEAIRAFVQDRARPVNGVRERRLEPVVSENQSGRSRRLNQSSN